MQESGSELHESLQTLSQKAEHNGVQNPLDEFVFDFTSMPTDADSGWELNADFVAAESFLVLNADLGEADSCFGMNADLAEDESSVGLNAFLKEVASNFGLNADLSEAVCGFELKANLANAERSFELNADLKTDEIITDNTCYDLQTEKGTKRKNSETIGSSDPLLSSDTTGYESDTDDEGEVKRARRKILRARRSRDNRVVSLDISRGVKRDLEADDTAEAPNKRLHHTSLSDESPVSESESSSDESVLDALGLELSSDSSSDPEESLASDSEPYVFSSSDSDTGLDHDDSSSDSDTCLERDGDGSSSDSDTCIERDDSSSDSDTRLKGYDSSSDSEFSSDFDSGLGYFTNLTSSDSENLDTDSEGSESSLLASRKLKCPKSCVCRAGPSNPPIPIERGGAVSTPLLKRLLRSRLLGRANLSPFYCCVRRCCLKWGKGFRR